MRSSVIIIGRVNTKKEKNNYEIHNISFQEPSKNNFTNHLDPISRFNFKDRLHQILQRGRNLKGFVLVRTKYENNLADGASFCSSSDEWDKELGIQIAKNRSLNKLGEMLCPTQNT